MGYDKVCGNSVYTMLFYRTLVKGSIKLNKWMIMNEDFVPKEIAKKLKEKGYYKKCFGYYLPSGDAGLIYNYNQYRGGIFEDCLFSHNSLGEDVVGHDLIDAPTISQIMKWFREEKQLFLEPYLFKGGYEPFIQSTIFEEDKDYTDMWRVEGFYPTYEEAAIAGIEYVLDNLI